MLRTHTCGELRKEHAGEIVTLAGWIHTIRTHGGVTFVDLRDRYGMTQLVFHEEVDLPRESVVQVTGTVEEKPEPNKKLKTGEVELQVSDWTLLNKSDVLPLDENATDETRLKWRYLDLRRPEMQQRLEIRHKASRAARAYLDGLNFREVETPLLVKSTPEGARDYVVPSRVNKGMFYALPQSPQIYKQILQVAGVDRYYQFARCLRDEDLRADRQPEHTQIDCEMSFVEVEDLLNTWEGLIKHIFKEVIDEDITEFPRIPYKEALEKYGLDKPDIRFEMHLSTITDFTRDLDFNVFAKAPCVRAIAVPQSYSRKEIDALTEFVKIYKAKGLAWTTVTENGLEGGVAKFLETIADKIIERTEANVGDTLFFGADEQHIVNEALGQLRTKLGREIYTPEGFAFCFITEFPLFDWDHDNECWVPAHHMFCQPLPGHEKKVESDPGSVMCTQYDMVLNGVEMASGSIRITDPKLQQQVFNVVGIKKEEAQQKFGFMLEAFKYGAPPHGGIGLGFDRLVAQMQGISDIREVIAFPKNKQAQCPMDGSPSPIDDKQLDELHLSLKK